MKALQSTLKFEAKLVEELRKRYESFFHLDKDKRTEFMISELPKLKGAISDSFEPYLRPYIDSEDQELRAAQDKNLAQDKLDLEGELKLLSSSLMMFQYFKQLLKRAQSYSRT